MSKLVDLTFYMTKGITPKYTEDKENSCEVLNQKCIRDFSINRELARLNNLLLKKVPEERFLQQYDVLINSTGLGTLGRVAQYFDISDEIVTIDSHILLVRSDKSKIDPLFFGYLLKSKQSIFETFAVGSTGQAELSRELVKNLELRFIEDKNKQKEIGEFLLSIDKKIQLNNKINQTLEQMVQALFKSWFVDFDPVKAKIATLENGGTLEEATLAAMSVISGKNEQALASFKNEQPEKYAELKATAELFPAEMQESELGEIPKGWDVAKLKDKTKIVYGKNLPKKKLLKVGYPVFGGNGEIGKYSEYLYKKQQVIISCRGAASGKVQSSLPYSFITNNSLVIEHEQGIFPYSYLYLFLLNTNLESYVSGSAQPQLTIASLDVVDILCPKESVLEKFDKIYSGLNIKRLMIDKENQLLVELRDSLLPKLLSGEISLSEVEAVNN